MGLRFRADAAGAAAFPALPVAFRFAAQKAFILSACFRR